MEAIGFIYVTAYDLRGCSDYPLELIFVLLTRAAVPASDGKCQDALNCSATELSRYGMTLNFFSCLRKKSRWWAFLMAALIFSSHFRSEEMVVPGNLNVLTSATSPATVSGTRDVFFFLKSNTISFVLDTFNSVILRAPASQPPNLTPVGRLIRDFDKTLQCISVI